MTNTETREASSSPYQRRSLTLAAYVQRRNGVPLGDPKSLQNMLHRAFGARSFGKFWQYWNPIWGYGLGKFVFTPLQRALSPPAALLMTFIISGFIHDLVTMAIRGSITFFFTPWFFILAIGILIGRVVKMDLAHSSWWTRASINVIYLSTGVVLTLFAKQALGIP